jgi:hypothetical protein
MVEKDENSGGITVEYEDSTECWEEEGAGLLVDVDDDVLGMRVMVGAVQMGSWGSCRQGAPAGTWRVRMPRMG